MRLTFAVIALLICLVQTGSAKMLGFISCTHKIELGGPFLICLQSGGWTFLPRTDGVFSPFQNPTMSGGTVEILQTTRVDGLGDANDEAKVAAWLRDALTGLGRPLGAQDSLVLFKRGLPFIYKTKIGEGADARAELLSVVQRDGTATIIRTFETGTPLTSGHFSLHGAVIDSTFPDGLGGLELGKF